MGVKKLNSEYHSRYKTFKVHRPVTTKAKFLSHAAGSAPEDLESSRRAGLLSNQFTNVTEPALQRKRIVPYKHNHNILSTNTVKELNDRDWLEAVGNGEDSEISSASVRRKDAKKTEDTEYISSFAKLKVEEDSPIILASKAKMKEKTKHRKSQAKKSPALRHVEKPRLEKSPESLPPAGIPTYVTDPQDKRLLRPCEDLLYPIPSQEENRNSQTEYSERYKSSASARMDKKPAPSSNIDLATYKKVLLQRNDAYGLPSSTSPGKQQPSPKSEIQKEKRRRPQSARRHSSESKQSGSYTFERKDKELAKGYNLPRSKHKTEKLMSKKSTRMPSPRRSLDEESLSSIRSANHLEASRKLRRGVTEKYGESKHEHLYADSVSSFNSQKNKSKHKKEKLIPVYTHAKNSDSERDLEKEMVSSTRSFESKTKKRSEKLQAEKRPRSSKNYKGPKQTRKGKIEDTRGSRRISRDTKRSSVDIQERGRSPTPEMRTAGHSRRHHLDVTTGSSNPLATCPDYSRSFGSIEYERVAYDPSKYSDVGESLTSSRSFAFWSERDS
mgnify:FL=1